MICFRGEVCSSKVDHCLLHWDDADEQVDAEDDDVKVMLMKMRNMMLMVTPTCQRNA